MPAQEAGVTVVVTGATGYIASHLIYKLLQKGYRVRGTVRSLENSKKVENFLSAFSTMKNNLELVEADLMNEESWIPVMQGGIKHVYHVASPAIWDDPEHEDEVLKPAVDGTLGVLKACRAAGTVQRVVVTSSIAAVINWEHVDESRALTEADWGSTTDSMYQKSKILAERAAWDFVEALPDREKFELAVVNPGLVVGPLLYNGPCTSTEIINMLLKRTTSMLPRAKAHVVDVRNVAEAQIRAMTLPEAAGHRHLLVQYEGWFRDMADIVHAEFSPMGYNVPQCNMPSAVIKLAALFNKRARSMSRVVGTDIKIDTTRFNKVLGIPPAPIDKPVIEMCHSMIQLGLSKRTKNYRAPKAFWNCQ